MREAEKALHRFRATAVGFSELQRDEEDRNDELQDFIAMQEMIEKEMDSTTVSEEEMETLCGILGKLRWSADWHFIGFEEIPYASLTITGESIGEGGFGVIKKAYYAGVQVAVKELRPELRFNNSDLAAFRGQVKDLEELRRKIKLNAGLKFPYIVQLFGACTVPPTICLVMELSDHGSLYDVLKRAREKGDAYDAYETPDWEEKLAILSDVTRAISYLHQNGMLHYDLKSTNVLVFDKWRAKVCDIGLAKIDKIQTSISHRSTKMPTGAYWMAPEIMENKGYTAQADIYGIGMIMYEVISGKVPFEEMQDPLSVAKAVVPAERPASEDVNKEMVRIVQEIGGDCRRSRRKVATYITAENIAESPRKAIGITTGRIVESIKASDSPLGNLANDMTTTETDAMRDGPPVHSPISTRRASTIRNKCMLQ
ncbi:kinase-like domain-containing protein [Tribonema minus]|uniref:Kinase-like domain-containing protein n=1 Tax=Tribonema minus TaxID=303371 RepID=A0A835Z762_9STRA|nr:kinase-like domain-containing protein [Tribonema minus]